jgi:hypothetical protein
MAAFNGEVESFSSSSSSLSTSAALPGSSADVGSVVRMLHTSQARPQSAERKLPTYHRATERCSASQELQPKPGVELLHRSSSPSPSPTDGFPAQGAHRCLCSSRDLPWSRKFHPVTFVEPECGRTAASSQSRWDSLGAGRAVVEHRAHEFGRVGILRKIRLGSESSPVTSG